MMQIRRSQHSLLLDFYCNHVLAVTLQGVFMTIHSLINRFLSALSKPGDNPCIVCSSKKMLEFAE